ncbi:MAG: M20/M25/M40 family metallo-hydrolase [Patescibacteria group bacterium]
MNKKSKEFLFKYLNSYSPVGYETSGQQIWLDYISKFVDTKTSDVYGNVVGIINPEKPYKIVIEAHADEISWLVSRITNEGYIYVVRNGGSDHQIAPSSRVSIHTDTGLVKGVFGWPAIHVRSGKEEIAPTVQNIFIDIGAETKDEVESSGVHVGSVVTMDGELIELGKNYLTGRALDDRIGGFITAEVVRKIEEEGDSLPFGLYIVNAVQEETGCRGGAMIARQVKPNVALCIDVCHDTKSPLYNQDSGDIKCGLGPVLSWGAPVQNELLSLVAKTAEKEKIKFQRLAAAGWTGTDTDSFAYSSYGVAAALVSVPLKYMHTTVETIHKDDVENTIELIYNTLLNIKNNQDFRYLKI